MEGPALSTACRGTKWLLSASNSMSHLLLLAQAAPNQGNFIWLVAPFFIVMVYLLIWRPQQKQVKDQQSLMSSLKKGDDVVTQAGVLGKVVSVQDKIVTIEVSSSLKLRVLKSSIQGRLVEEAPKVEEPASKEKEEK